LKTGHKICGVRLAETAGDFKASIFAKPSIKKGINVSKVGKLGDIGKVQTEIFDFQYFSVMLRYIYMMIYPPLLWYGRNIM
jgi:hypothetical protein